MIRKLAKRLRAWALLAWRLAINLATRPFKKTGLPKFEANFAPEGIFALTPEERARAAAFSRCIGCGLCETLCAGLQGTPARKPRLLAIAESRSLPDLDAARATATAFLGCEACHACEAACPTGVPLRELATFVVAHGAHGEVPSPTPPPRSTPGT